jgi:hypothetical protein
MLSWIHVSRCTTFSTILRPCRRTIVTSAANKAKKESFSLRRDKIAGIPNRSAHVKLSHFLDSPLELYTVIRALERRYGTIKQWSLSKVFKLHSRLIISNSDIRSKDYETPSKYQTGIVISFKDHDAFRRIPRDKGDSFKVSLPGITSQEGGLGLANLEGILLPQEYIPQNPQPRRDKLSISEILAEQRETVENDQKESISKRIEVQIQRARGLSLFESLSARLISFRS